MKMSSDTRDIVSIGVALAALLCTFAGCRSQERPATAAKAAATERVEREADRVALCGEQAVQLAEWRGRFVDPARPPAWVSRYSPRDDVCYELIALAVPNAQDRVSFVTELWDVFGAAVLASSTTDRRPEIRHRFCQVNLSDDPFTSCAVADFFITTHMME